MTSVTACHQSRWVSVLPSKDHLSAAPARTYVVIVTPGQVGPGHLPTSQLQRRLAEQGAALFSFCNGREDPCQLREFHKARKGFRCSVMKRMDIHHDHCIVLLQISREASKTCSSSDSVKPVCESSQAKQRLCSQISLNGPPCRMAYPEGHSDVMP